MRNVLIAGGAGYVGTLLTPQLLAAGYNVTVYDIMYYGCELKPQPRLKIIKGDIRDTAKFREACWGVDAVIQLACISNDAGFELDEKLSESINYEAFEPMVIAAREQEVNGYIANIDRAVELIGFDQNQSLADHLPEVVNYWMRK